MDDISWRVLIVEHDFETGLSIILLTRLTVEDCIKSLIPLTQYFLLLSYQFTDEALISNKINTDSDEMSTRLVIP